MISEMSPVSAFGRLRAIDGFSFCSPRSFGSDLGLSSGLVHFGYAGAASGVKGEFSGVIADKGLQSVVPSGFPSSGSGLPRFRKSALGGAWRMSSSWDVPPVSCKASLACMNPVWRRLTRDSEFSGHARTMYKRKADKINPVDSSKPIESPYRNVSWKKEGLARAHRQLETIQHKPGEWDGISFPRFSEMPKGQRLTPDRLTALKVGIDLKPRERDLLLSILSNREAALAWDFSECGRVREDVVPPQEINTIEHEPWRTPNHSIPRALKDVAIGMVRERLDRGVIEPAQCSYRNPWFLVKKQNGKYRMINNAIYINQYTVRDANLPPSVEQFAEEFAGMSLVTLADLFSGYDQVTLAESSRDLTAFWTELGLMRHTTLPQGATNSVAQFVRAMTTILDDLIPNTANCFLDDIGIKGPRSTYEDAEAMPGIRRYVLEHLVNIDQTLLNLELAGVCVSVEKTSWCVSGIKMVGFVCDSDGRHPESTKVLTILDWPACVNVSQVRGFLGLTGYYRMFVWRFSEKAAPLYTLLKSNVEFNWSTKEQLSMDRLKEAITTAPALVTIDYSAEAGRVYMGFDASLVGWGGYLAQEVDGKRHPARFESGIWSSTQSNYDAGRREALAGVLCLKKFQAWLYGRHFILETDALILAKQLRRTVVELPGAQMTRWIAFMLLFDFDVVHVSGKKHTAADALSRRPAAGPDDSGGQKSEDIEDWLDARLSSISSMDSNQHVSSFHGAGPAELDVEENLLDPEGGYSENSHAIAQYLQDFRRPAIVPNSQFKRWRTLALQHLVIDGHLYKKYGKHAPLRRVIDGNEEQSSILQELHEETGHRGVESTYRKIADRYFWPNLYKVVKSHVQTCATCQLRAGARQDEPMHPTYENYLNQRWHIDVVHMPQYGRYKYIVMARKELSKWVEGAALVSATASAVSNFIKVNILTRHGMFDRLVVDGGPENRGLAQELVDRYGIKRIQSSAYHPQSNGLVERGHLPVVDGLAKLRISGQRNWPEHLPFMLWADRVSVNNTGYTPFFLEYGHQAVLPVDLEFPSWIVHRWHKVRTTEELLAMRCTQLERRDEDVTNAALRIRRLREMNKDIFDNSHQIRNDPLKIDDIVLVHETQLEHSHSKKLLPRWRGPYRVKLAHDKGFYKLEELDGAQLRGTYAGNRLKRFHARGQVIDDLLDEAIPECPAVAEPGLGDIDEEDDAAIGGPDLGVDAEDEDAQAALDENEENGSEQDGIDELEAIDNDNEVSALQEDDKYLVEKILEVRRFRGGGIKARAKWSDCDEDRGFYDIDGFSDSRDLLDDYYANHPEKPKPEWMLLT